MNRIPPMSQEMKEAMRTAQPIPKGYISADNKLTPAIVAKANQILKSKPLGYTEYKKINDNLFFFRCEPHYDNHVGGVYQWHKGVSVYTPKDQYSTDMPSDEKEPSKLQDSSIMSFIDKSIEEMKKEIKNLIT